MASTHDLIAPQPVEFFERRVGAFDDHLRIEDQDPIGGRVEQRIEALFLV